MAYLNCPFLLITIFIFFKSTTPIAAAVISRSDDRQSSPEASLYDVLKSNGLPVGLFPKGISGFSIDPSSGRFQLHLLSPSPCKTKFETHLRYESHITGTLGYGRITDLSGLSAQELFLWLPVRAIRVDIPSSGLIYFDVGVVFKQFSLSFFETPKDCDALAEGDEGDDVVFFRDHHENQSGEFLRKHFKDEEPRAVS